MVRCAQGRAYSLGLLQVKAHLSFSNSGKYHEPLTSRPYLYGLGCFENRENVLQAEMQLIPTQ